MPENTKIVLNDRTTGVASGAFENCSNLTSITIPDGVKGIELKAFKDCNSLKSITIPYSVTMIGNYAFENWTSDQTIYIKGRTSPPNSVGAFGSEIWSDYWNEGCNAKIVWNS